MTTRSETDEFGRTLYSEADRVIVDRVHEVAAKRGVAAAVVALAWVMRNVVVTAPIVGVTKMSHLDDALTALDLDLDQSEAALLEEPYVPHHVAGIA